MFVLVGQKKIKGKKKRPPQNNIRGSLLAAPHGDAITVRFSGMRSHVQSRFTLYQPCRMGHFRFSGSSKGLGELNEMLFIKQALLLFS